jgi:streptomycin 6-kinase
VKIPTAFSQCVKELHGPTGTEWLDLLPSTLDELAQRWSLTLSPPFEPLSYNYVMPALRADGRPVVLKVGVPNPELSTEIEALRVFDGRGSVMLLEADPERGALLLECLEPGEALTILDDDEKATSIAVDVMQQLWREVPTEHPFPTVAKWAEGLKRLRRTFDGGCGPFPEDLVEKAEASFKDLLADPHQSVLLHGDLHHGNILTAEREPWLSLDPKGIVGEAAYEVGAFLRNPMPQLLLQPDPDQLLARRVDQMAEGLGFDRERLLRWGIAQAVLSAWWSYEDHGHGWEPAITCARYLTAIAG